MPSAGACFRPFWIACSLSSNLRQRSNLRRKNSMSGATTTRVLVAAALAAGLASVGTSFAQQQAPDTLEAHIRAATVAAGLELGGILTLCLSGNGPASRPEERRAR